eukprot:COSAG02_NODE_227_length_28153_cov_11.662294_7_plen_224_part_00
MFPTAHWVGLGTATDRVQLYLPDGWHTVRRAIPRRARARGLERGVLVPGMWQMLFINTTIASGRCGVTRGTWLPDWLPMLFSRDLRSSGFRASRSSADERRKDPTSMLYTYRNWDSRLHEPRFEKQGNIDNHSNSIVRFCLVRFRDACHENHRTRKMCGKTHYSVHRNSQFQIVCRDATSVGGGARGPPPARGARARPRTWEPVGLSSTRAFAQAALHAISRE